MERSRRAVGRRHVDPAERRGSEAAIQSAVHRAFAARSRLRSAKRLGRSLGGRSRRGRAGERSAAHCRLRGAIPAPCARCRHGRHVRARDRSARGWGLEGVAARSRAGRRISRAPLAARFVRRVAARQGGPRLPCDRVSPFSDTPTCERGHQHVRKPCDRQFERRMEWWPDPARGFLPRPAVPGPIDGRQREAGRRSVLRGQRTAAVRAGERTRQEGRAQAGRRAHGRLHNRCRLGHRHRRRRHALAPAKASGVAGADIGSRRPAWPARGDIRTVSRAVPTGRSTRFRASTSRRGPTSGV